MLHFSTGIVYSDSYLMAGARKRRRTSSIDDTLPNSQPAKWPGNIRTSNFWIMMSKLWFLDIMRDTERSYHSERLFQKSACRLDPSGLPMIQVNRKMKKHF